MYFMPDIVSSMDDTMGEMFEFLKRVMVRVMVMPVPEQAFGRGAEEVAFAVNGDSDHMVDREGDAIDDTIVLLDDLLEDFSKKVH